jgi:hypothetical protein
MRFCRIFTTARSIWIGQRSTRSRQLGRASSFGPLWDDPRAEHGGFSILYVRSRLPVAEATLSVSGVTNTIVADNARIGRYSFCEIQPTPNGVRLHFNEDLDIDLELDGINATYEERPLPELCAIYRQYFLVQSGPFIETDAA